MRIMEVWALVALGYWLFMLWDTVRSRKWMFSLPRSAGDAGFNIEKSNGRENRKISAAPG